MKGKIIKSTGMFYKILSENTIVEATLKGKFKLENKKITNPISVGDWVDFTNEGKNETAYTITKIHPRSNYIIRKSPEKKEHSHIIASNIDLLVIIASLSQPRTTLGFIDRLLVSAESFGIESLLVFNKKDSICPSETPLIEEYKKIYESIGYPVLLISAFEKNDIHLFLQKIEKKVSILVGHSGVGKSTILNNLGIPIAQKTNEISQFTEKGKHTTTFAEMFLLPNNTFIIDTPGIKEFGIPDMKAVDIKFYFPEIQAIAEHCKFF